MKNKTIIMITIMCIFSLFCEICCFAADDNSINLGNTVSETMNKAGRSMENVKNDVFSGEMMKDEEKMVENGANHLENGVKDVENKTMDTTGGIVNNTRTDNRKDNGYNTIKTQTSTELANTRIGTMSTTTWMWMVLAISAVIIIAAVWYYATQNNGRD